MLRYLGRTEQLLGALTASVETSFLLKAFDELLAWSSKCHAWSRVARDLVWVSSWLGRLLSCIVVFFTHFISEVLMMSEFVELKITAYQIFVQKCLLMLTNKTRKDIMTKMSASSACACSRFQRILQLHHIWRMWERTSRQGWWTTMFHNFSWITLLSANTTSWPQQQCHNQARFWLLPIKKVSSPNQSPSTQISRRRIVLFLTFVLLAWHFTKHPEDQEGWRSWRIVDRGVT